MDDVRIGIFIDCYSGSGVRAINNAYTVYNTAFGYSLPNFGGNVMKLDLSVRSEYSKTIIFSP